MKTHHDRFGTRKREYIQHALSANCLLCVSVSLSISPLVGAKALTFAIWSSVDTLGHVFRHHWLASKFSSAFCLWVLHSIVKRFPSFPSISCIASESTTTFQQLVVWITRRAGPLKSYETTHHFPNSPSRSPIHAVRCLSLLSETRVIILNWFCWRWKGESGWSAQTDRANYV